jgi:hypothetical protein
MRQFFLLFCVVVVVIAALLLYLLIEYCIGSKELFAGEKSNALLGG